MQNASTVFADTNILLYAASGRQDEAAKTIQARQLLRQVEGCLSFQVLQEFYANATSSRKLGLSDSEAQDWCKKWLQCPIASLTAETFIKSLELSQRYKISNWDAAIIAAAKQLGCTTVYSQDLNHGQDYDDVQVINPFLGL